MSRGIILRHLSKYLLILFVALQPLHSYSIINIKSNDDNGFKHLDAELCGAQYTPSISHTQKLSKLIDKVNSLYISNISDGSICCQALDINSTHLIDLSSDNFVVSTDDSIQRITFYSSEVKKSLTYRFKTRAPPYA